MDQNDDSPIIPNLSKARKSVLKSTEELEYGLRAIVRILCRRKGATGGYFFDGFQVKFADELGGRSEITA